MVAKRLAQMACHWKVVDLISAATFVENLVLLQIYKKFAWKISTPHTLKTLEL